MPPSKGTILITGAARRIGKAAALELARQGYAIALHYNRSAQEAEQVAKEIRMLGSECEIFQCELTDIATIKPLMEQVFTRFPDCHTLINSASIFERGTFMETDESLLDRHFAINFKAPFFLTQAFAKRCNKGQVINFLDTYVTKHKSPSYFAYLLSKKALYEFTQMAAWELAPDIRVNAICPGITELPSGYDEAFLNRKRQELPLKQFVKIDDVISALCSIVHSDFMTGQCIFVDSGEHLL